MGALYAHHAAKIQPPRKTFVACFVAWLSAPLLGLEPAAADVALATRQSWPLEGSAVDLGKTPAVSIDTP